LSDIAEAIAAHQKAVQLTPFGHANLPSHLNSLGRSFCSQFEHTSNLSDIAEAISALQKAVQLTPLDHANLPSYLRNLGGSLKSHFVHTGNPYDIAKAISAHQQAVQLTPSGHTYLPCYLNSLGISLRSCFHYTGNSFIIAKSVSAHQRAVDLTPSGHADLCCWLINLGDSFYILFQVTEMHEHLDTSIYHLKNASGSSFGHPSKRLKAAKKWAQLSFKYYPQSPETLIAFDTAINLLSLVAGLEQTVQHRYSQLQNLSDLPLQAAATACSLGCINKALQWLEQGRCLVWTQLVVCKLRPGPKAPALARLHTARAYQNLSQAPDQGSGKVGPGSGSGPGFKTTIFL
jgi:tetratricopeptide (TPR) repeat protein